MRGLRLRPTPSLAQLAKTALARLSQEKSISLRGALPGWATVYAELVPAPRFNIPTADKIYQRPPEPEPPTGGDIIQLG